MPQELVERLKSQAQDARSQVESTREQLVGGSPGQTEIAGDMMNEVQSRMSERFDVVQERRPRVLSDIAGIDDLPIDVTEGAGGLMDREPLLKREKMDFSGGKQASKEKSTGIQFSG